MGIGQEQIKIDALQTRMTRIFLFVLSVTLVVVGSTCGSPPEPNVSVQKPVSGANAPGPPNNGQPNTLDNLSVSNPVNVANSQTENPILNRRKKGEPVQQMG